MNYYFSDSAVRYDHEEFKVKYCKNRLFSYAYKSAVRRFFLIYLDLWYNDRIDLKDHSVIIDSGAYSVWNSGKKPIDIDEYIKFCLDIHDMFGHMFKKIEYVSLDVIPGEKGRETTPDDIKYAQETGWSNYEYIFDRVPNVLGVFHQGDDFQYLHDMENKSDRYCVSPRNDASTDVKLAWLNDVFRVIKNNAKPHGLGFSSQSVSKHNDWYSFDAATHALRAAFGTVVYFNGEQMMDFVFSDVRLPEDTGTHYLKLKPREQMLLRDEFLAIDEQFTFDNLVESGTTRHLINCYFMSKYYEKYNYSRQAIQESLF